jgi:replicative DNA helicase
MSEKKVKIAPHSKESEMMVLGCMLTSINSMNAAADMLDDSDFYFKEHKIIFNTLKTLYKQDKPADIHIVAEDLKGQERLEEIGGLPYLTTLAQYAGTAAYIEEYVELVKNKSLLRRMITAAQGIEKNALNEPSDVNSALDSAQAQLFAISQSASNSQATDLRDLLTGVKAESNLPYLKELQERQERFCELGEDAVAFTGVPTHLLDLDKTIDGLGASNLIIVAGRPAMGKTAFCVNIAENVCFKSNVPVGIFSLEMSGEQLLHRMICSQSGVESDKIRTGSLSGVEYQQIVQAVKKMQEHTMIIDDQPGINISDLRSRARRMKEAHDIQLLVIDYLQLLSGASGSYSSDNRQNEISEISRNLKNLARELNIPIICPSQLSRKVEERQGHRPMMSDLRESGSIEQDADVVIFLLRREYYDPYDKPGLAEIIVAKNRHGKIGSVELAFRKEFAQFTNYTPVSTETDNTEAFAAFTPNA